MSTKNTETLPCLVVCGEPSSARIRQSVLPHLDFKLEMVEADFKEDFLLALASRQPPLSVVDFQIPVQSLLEEVIGAEAADVPSELALMLAGGHGATVPAHEVFEEAVEKSPHTKFVIACHNKIQDTVKAQADEYMKHPAVIKRMGFINGLANMRYLAKLFTKTYTGRTWKPTF